MRLFRIPRFLPVTLLALSLASVCLAQPVTPQQLVQEVVNNEIASNQNDHTHWMFRDANKTPEKNVVKLVIETADGSVSKTIRTNARPLTAEEQQQDQAKIQKVVADPAVRDRQRRNSAHDDKQAVAMMRMLPDAFIWTEVGRSNSEVTLHFKPNPAFQPPTYESRVFAAMAGEMVLDVQQKRLKVLSGTLIQPVEFGWGMLGKLKEGGTFHVVHSEVAPGKWEITQTHVHIEGHALFFKSISEQEDEVSSHYKLTPAHLTLQQAAQMLNDGTADKELNSLEK